MSWLRFEASFFSDPRVMLSGFWGANVWIAAVTMAKQQGWHGRIRREHFTPEIIAHHLHANAHNAGLRYEPSPGMGPTVTNGETVIEAFRLGIEACVKNNLFTQDAEFYYISDWDKLQKDPTGNERQRRFQSKAKADRLGARNGNPVNNGIRDVRTSTPTPSGVSANNAAKPYSPPPRPAERWWGEHRFGPHNIRVSETISELDARKPRLSRDDFVRISNDEKETELIRAAASKAVFIRDQRSSW